MAWNQSNNYTRIKKSKRFSFKGLAISLALVIAVIIGLGYFFFADNTTNEETLSLSNPEKEVRKTTKKHQASKSKTKIKSPAVEEKQELKSFKISVDEYGVRRYPNGVRVYDDKTPISKPTTPFGDNPIFKNKALNEIASFINLTPGAALFGTRNYDQAYVKILRKGLEEEIVILDEDDDKTRQTKLEMIEIQKEFKGMSDAQILSIVKDTYSELQRLSRYKNQIKSMVNEIVKNTPEISEQDYNDLISAANEMLKKEGIAPIRNTVLIRKSIKLNNVNQE